MAVTNSTRKINSDPLRNYNFVVSFADSQLSGYNMGFMSVSGLNVTTEIIPYREGGMNNVTQKMPGQSDFGPITLSHGVILGTNVKSVNWFTRVFSVQDGVDAVRNFRTKMFIDVLSAPAPTHNESEGPAARRLGRFTVYNVWPTSFAYSDLDAGANSAMVSQMSVANEGWTVDWANSQNGIGSPVAFPVKQGY